MSKLHFDGGGGWSSRCQHPQSVNFTTFTPKCQLFTFAPKSTFGSFLPKCQLYHFWGGCQNVPKWRFPKIPQKLNAVQTPPQNDQKWHFFGHSQNRVFQFSLRFTFGPQKRPTGIAFLITMPIQFGEKKTCFQVNGPFLRGGLKPSVKVLS